VMDVYRAGWLQERSLSGALRDKSKVLIWLNRVSSPFLGTYAWSRAALHDRTKE
jgi:hypothetical protein